MRKGSGPSLGLRVLALLTGSLVLLGDSCPGGGNPPPPPHDFFLLFQKKVADIQAAHPNNRVAVAVAIGNNQVVPETLTVTSDTHFVVWLVLGTKPNLVFKGAAPFTFTCQDFLCYSDAAASSGGQAKVNVEYDLTFTAIGGAPVKADPHLEVVK